MKILVTILVFIFVCFIIFLAFSLERENKQTLSNQNVLSDDLIYITNTPISKVVFENHDYLFIHKGCIIHSKSCVCKKELEKLEK